MLWSTSTSVIAYVGGYEQLARYTMRYQESEFTSWCSLIFTPAHMSCLQHHLTNSARQLTNRNYQLTYLALLATYISKT